LADNSHATIKKLNACQVVQRKPTNSLCWPQRNFSDIIVHRDEAFWNGTSALSQKDYFLFIGLIQARS